jgi:hypothetical protein
LCVGFTQRAHNAAKYPIDGYDDDDKDNFKCQLHRDRDCILWDVEMIEF